MQHARFLLWSIWLARPLSCRSTVAGVCVPMRWIGYECRWAGRSLAILRITVADTAVLQGRWSRRRRRTRPADHRDAGSRALHAVGIGPADRVVVRIVIGAARQVLGQQQGRGWRSSGIGQGQAA